VPNSAAAVACVSWDQFSEEFIQLYSRATIQTRSQIRSILREVGNLAEISTVPDLTPETVTLLVLQWMKSQLVRVTIQNRLRVLRTVCKYAVNRGYLSSNPVEARGRWIPDGYDGLPLPMPKSRPGLSHDEVTRLLIRLQDASTTWDGHRLFALVATVVYAGLHTAEALNLEWEHCDTSERIIRILKCSLERRARRFPPKLAEILDQWRPLCGSEWVFPGAMLVGPWTGGNSKSKPLSRLKAAGLAVDIEGLNFDRLREFWERSSPGLELPIFESEPPPVRRYTGPERPKPGPKPSNPPPVWDFSRGIGKRPLLRGKLLPLALTKAEIDVIQGMIEAGCLDGERLSESDLVEKCHRPDPVRILRLLKNKPPLDGEILFPGKGGIGGYGLRGR
jgi:integrase